MNTSRIAVLISGTYREIEFLLNIFPQIMGDMEHDIYVVLRHTAGEVSRLGDREIDFKLPDSASNVFMCELPVIDKDEAHKRYLIPVGPTDNDRECAILSMFQGVFTAISMMKSSMRHYDYAMKTRTDYLPPRTIQEMVGLANQGKIVVDGCANWYRRYPDRFDILWQGSLNDILCFATYDDFLKLWDFEPLLQKVWTGIPETTLFRVAMLKFLGDEMQSPRRNESFLKKYFTWDENDTKQSFHVLRQRHGLPKPDEATYFKGDEVIKYFVDKTRVEQKVERAKLLRGFVPNLQKVSGNFFTYKYVDGEMLSDSDPDTFASFLDFMQENIWKPVDYEGDFVEACAQFYRIKTRERLAMMNIQDRKETINGVEVPSYYDMDEDIDWKWLCDGVPVLFHGDPQPENVIVTPNGFCLLDWRENFGGLTECGDVYYDLAKIYHALIVSGEIVRRGGFALRTNPIDVSIGIKPNLMESRNTFEKFVEGKYDMSKIKVLTGLIYLNIAPLHAGDYGKFLYYFGKKYLSESLGRYNV